MDARKVGFEIAAVGGAMQALGFGVDGWLHASDPELSSRENIFTLTSPGHFLVYAGLGMVIVGLVVAFVCPVLGRVIPPEAVWLLPLAMISVPLVATVAVVGLAAVVVVSGIGSVTPDTVVIAAAESQPPGRPARVEAALSTPALSESTSTEPTTEAPAEVPTSAPETPPLSVGQIFSDFSGLAPSSPPPTGGPVRPGRQGPPITAPTSTTRPTTNTTLPPPATTIPETTIPETTIPETTIPETTIPGTTIEPTTTPVS
jgi:hypothetical protein